MHDADHDIICASSALVVVLCVRPTARSLSALSALSLSLSLSALSLCALSHFTRTSVSLQRTPAHQRTHAVPPAPAPAPSPSPRQSHMPQLRTDKHERTTSLPVAGAHTQRRATRISPRHSRHARGGGGGGGKRGGCVCACGHFRAEPLSSVQSSPLSRHRLGSRRCRLHSRRRRHSRCRLRVLAPWLRRQTPSTPPSQEPPTPHRIFLFDTMSSVRIQSACSPALTNESLGSSARPSATKLLP